ILIFSWAGVFFGTKLPPPPHRQFVIYCFTRFYSLATHGLVIFNQPLFSYCCFSGSACILKFIARSQHIRRN
ncbi:hypothetical protein, partial [Shewanella algae]|uniref:hypothetical protein n=1 Tax=Shewanella algae TaxID=38313 RepID=UPI0031F49AFF